MNSQKLSDAAELPVRVNQLMSGRLESPRINTGLNEVVIVVKYIVGKVSMLFYGSIWRCINGDNHFTE